MQQIGTQRNSDGSFNFAGQTTAACKEGDTAGSAGAATALQGRLTGATFKAIGDGDEDDLTLAKATAGSPETVHVWVNKEDIQLIDGITISACNMAVLIIRPTANQSFCAIIIKGSKHAGVGYDASESGSIEGEPRHALCIPPTANLKADGAATGGFTEEEVAHGIAPKCWAAGKAVSAKCTTTDKGTNTIIGAGGSVLSFYETSIPDAERKTL